MKTISYMAVVCALISLLGCGSLIQEVDPGNLPTAVSKPVIHCFISPQDTAIAVYVQGPRQVLGTTTSNSSFYSFVGSIPNAVVTLSDGTRTVQLPGVGGQYPNYYGISTQQFPIMAGRTYSLTVSTPGFPTVTAQCTVPGQVSPTELRIDSLTRTQLEPPQTTYVGRLVWQDPAGQTNFYNVSGRSIETYTYTMASQPGTPARDTTMTDISSLSFDNTNLFTDSGKDGEQLISSKAERILYARPELKNRSLRLKLTLSNVDENYYRYHEAVARQADIGENPFAEPVLIPSNIQGGLGCFGAFNQSSLTVRVR